MAPKLYEFTGSRFQTISHTPLVVTTSVPAGVAPIAVVSLDAPKSGNLGSSMKGFTDKCQFPRGKVEGEGDAVRMSSMGQRPAV